MCCGEVNSGVAAVSSVESTLKWQLQQVDECWRLIVEAPTRPDVDLCATEIKLVLSGTDESVLLPVPAMALPIDVACAACKFSKKRGALTLEWPRQPLDETKDSQSASEEGSTEEALTTEEIGSESTEASAAEEVASGVPAPEEASKETGSIDCLKAESPVIQEISAEEFKTLGNEAIKQKDLQGALEHYSNGIRVDPSHYFLISNRALCHYKLGNLEEALQDALQVTALKPDFHKGYIRGALALRELHRPQEALALLKKAPHNDEVGKLVSEVRPEAEAAEKTRIASLDGPERLKEEGNALFKKGLYEQAIPKYTEVIESVSDADSELMLAVRNNRAACNHQLSNFHAVIEDSTWVLERDPDNLKALVRRMIALEPLEKYEKALEDARKILRHCPGHEIANKVQHRLGRLVRQGY